MDEHAKRVPYDMRHIYTSLVSDSGITAEEVAQHLGHNRTSAFELVSRRSDLLKSGARVGCPGAHSSAAERRPYKADVTGSIPVGPTVRRVIQVRAVRNGAAVVERLELAELTHLVELHKRTETKRRRVVAPVDLAHQAKSTLGQLAQAGAGGRESLRSRRSCWRPLRPNLA
jgi:hypothetical protein